MGQHDVTFLSGYRILWCLVMFDLPTDTKPQRKAATKFREFLLDEGFDRAQFSVYARFVNGHKGFETRVRCVEMNLPDWGDVQILQFTDKPELWISQERIVFFKSHFGFMIFQTIGNETREKMYDCIYG